MIISLKLFLAFLGVILFLISAATSANTIGVKCLQKEKKALLKFKAGLIDDDDQLSSWENEEDCCQWDGAMCDNRTNHNRVVEIDLSRFSSLRGKTISPSLLELDELSRLDLSYINFDGTKIPNFIGSLTKLHYLNMRECSFEGEIPHSLGNLSTLQFLNLSRNYMLYTNHLGWLSGFQSLQILDLSFVSIDARAHSRWLQAMNKLSMVKEIYLRGCSLHDALPISPIHLVNASNSLLVLDLAMNSVSLDSVFPWLLNHSNSLRYIDLSSNEIEEGIPYALKNLRYLSHLNLNGNSIDGTIPEILWNLTHLSYLDLSDNSLEGAIANSVGNLMSLLHLDLSMNKLQGRIPTALGNLTSLCYLGLSYNQLHGEFTSHFSSLAHLDLSYNRLQGDFTHLMMHIWDSTLLEHIGLRENVLFGSLPNMSRFQYLKKLSLRDNCLNGSMGEDSLRLPALEYLDLSRNRLTGMIPNLSSCLSLRKMRLDDNMFNGTLTESIGTLFQLQELRLGSNHLEGLISEAHFFNLSKLLFLGLSFNSNLTLRFNSFWTPPFQLVIIQLAQCRLGPHFPQWLQTQQHAGELDVSNSKIWDTIPDWFWNNFDQVWYLNMSHNNIHGTLPHWSFLNMGFLYLDLSFNRLRGTLPPMPLYVSGSDGMIILSWNKFSGTLVYCNYQNLHHLDISNNLLVGHLSQDCFKILSGLSYLNLENNNFSGNIQVGLASCHLSSLHLRNNKFNGYIPKSLAACHNLNILDLGENKFVGTLPDWLGDSLPKLIVLSLKSNQFHGTLPCSICHLSRIQVLDISRNKISGTIPQCISNFTMLSSKSNFSSISNDLMKPYVGQTSWYESFSIMWKGKNSEYIRTLWLLKAIDFSCNKLSGEIPREITWLVELVSLNLSRNHLIGSIPHGINRLELLDILDLSWNNLSGGIPSTLSQLSYLGTLNLSFNNLSGKIPWDTHMVTFDAASYIGNPGLCGPPLVSKPCRRDVQIPRKPILMNWIHDDIFKTRELYIGMVFGFIVAFWGIFGILFFNRRWNITLVKVFTSIDDWIYVKLRVNRSRLRTQFQNRSE